MIVDDDDAIKLGLHNFLYKTGHYTRLGLPPLSAKMIQMNQNEKEKKSLTVYKK